MAEDVHFMTSIGLPSFGVRRVLEIAFRILRGISYRIKLSNIVCVEDFEVKISDSKTNRRKVFCCFAE